MCVKMIQYLPFDIISTKCSAHHQECEFSDVHKTTNHKSQYVVLFQLITMALLLPNYYLVI